MSSGRLRLAATHPLPSWPSLEEAIEYVAFQSELAGTWATETFYRNDTAQPAFPKAGSPDVLLQLLEKGFGGSLLARAVDATRRAGATLRFPSMVRFRGQCASEGLGMECRWTAANSDGCSRAQAGGAALRPPRRSVRPGCRLYHPSRSNESSTFGNRLTPSGAIN
jgi:hypothetical protein